MYQSKRVTIAPDSIGAKPIEITVRGHVDHDFLVPAIAAFASTIGLAAFDLTADVSPADGIPHVRFQLGTGRTFIAYLTEHASDPAS